jgi:hypothetical protein
MDRHFPSSRSPFVQRPQRASSSPLALTLEITHGSIGGFIASNYCLFSVNVFFRWLSVPNVLSLSANN